MPAAQSGEIEVKMLEGGSLTLLLMSSVTVFYLHHQRTHLCSHTFTLCVLTHFYTLSHTLTHFYTLFSHTFLCSHTFTDEFCDCFLFAPSENTFVTPQGGSIIDLCLVFGPIHMDMGTPQIDRRNVHELFTGAPLRGHLPVINTIQNKQSQLKKVNPVFKFEEADWRSYKAELDNVFGTKLLEIESSTSTPSCTTLVEFFPSMFFVAKPQKKQV